MQKKNFKQALTVCLKWPDSKEIVVWRWLWNFSMKLIKFIYSEKATKFSEISTLLLSYFTFAMIKKLWLFFWHKYVLTTFLPFRPFWLVIFNIFQRTFYFHLVIKGQLIFRMSFWSENFFQNTNEIIAWFLPWNFF